MAEAISDEQRIEELRSQVDLLQLKLHQLHATDTNTLRRGFVTIAQHVDALKHEATRLEQLADELEPELYPPEYIAEEITKAAVVSGVVYGLFKLVKTITPLPAKAGSWLPGSLVAVTAIVVTWRFATSSIGRFAASLIGHKRRRKALLKEVAELQHRIDILHALTRSMPGVPQALQQQQQQQQVLADTASSAVMGTAFGTTAAAVAREASPGLEHKDTQFVVVDLPRVESGGFVLTSPTASSPAPEPVPAQQSAAAVAAATAALSATAVALQLPGTQELIQSGHILQQQLRAMVPASLTARAAAAIQEPESTGGAAEAAGSVPQQQRQLQQQAAEVAGGPSPSSSTQSSLESQQQQQQQQPPPSQEWPQSAFSPPSMIMSGWGGVLMQQEQRAQKQQQQQQQHGAQQGTAAAAGDRQASSDLEGQGEWVEQPNDNGGDATQQPQGQGSPASESSDEGVLLERE